jgi:hypothetical protein
MIKDVIMREIGGQGRGGGLSFWKIKYLRFEGYVAEHAGDRFSVLTIVLYGLVA